MGDSHVPFCLASTVHWFWTWRATGRSKLTTVYDRNHVRDYQHRDSVGSSYKSRICIHTSIAIVASLPKRALIVEGSRSLCKKDDLQSQGSDGRGLRQPSAPQAPVAWSSKASKKTKPLWPHHPHVLLIIALRIQIEQSRIYIYIYTYYLYVHFKSQLRHYLHTWIPRVLQSKCGLGVAGLVLQPSTTEDYY